MIPRVRFAPSPTGYLHVGGARTALFNWLFARRRGGVFALRIEDTDVERSSADMVTGILDGLRWLGLDWDEGPASGDAKAPSKGEHGPYFQSERGEFYQRRVAELRDKGLAYEKDGAIRFRMQREPIVIPDAVVGNVTRELTDREQVDPDFVIVRSDGQPVFHFVNVVDDLEMKITHVIRGEDHLSNTAKHLALFKAFGVEPPQYAHIPLILNMDGSKMSKRDYGASLTTYMTDGYAPEAVVNYLYLLGWSPKGNREIMPLAEVIEAFDLPGILRHNAKFDLTKLNWMNWEYIRSMEMDRFVAFASRALEQSGISLRGFDTAYIKDALGTCKEKLKQFTDAKSFADFYFVQDIEIEEASRKELNAESKRVMEAVRQAVVETLDFSADNIGAMIKKVAASLGVKAGPVVHPTRLACTGKTVGPSLYHLMEVLGKDRVLKRIDRFIAQCP